MKTSAAKILVKNVRINKDEVQSVRFSCKARNVFSARTRNHTPIRVALNEETGKYEAGNRAGGKVTANTPDAAFAKAVREIWAN